MNIKDYDKALRLGQPKKPLKESLSRPFRGLNLNFLKRSRENIAPIFKVLDNVPIWAYFCIFIVVMVVSLLVVNKLRYEHFAALLSKNYPELVTVPTAANGKPLYQSVIDKIIADFNSTINSYALIIGMIPLIEFTGEIWQNYNPRKVQVVIRRET